jgi:hypothetical protein
LRNRVKRVKVKEEGPARKSTEYRLQEEEAAARDIVKIK